MPAGLGLIAFVAGVFAAPALGQDVVEPFDSSSGYDHVSEPPDGAFSSVDWCFSFLGGDLIGQTVEVSAVGPDGPLTGTGVVADDGTVKVRVGITSGGDYTVTGVTAVDSGTSIESADVAEVSVVFDPELVDCFDELATAPPPTSETTTTTTTTAPPETTPPETAPPETAPPSDGRWPLALLAIGILLLIGGLLTAYWPDVTITTTTKCERERREVARIEEELRKAREAEKKFRDEAKGLEAEAHKLDFSRAGGSQRQKDAMKAKENRAKARELDRKADQTAALIKTFEDQLAKAKRALDACLERGGGTAPPTSPGSTPGPNGSSSETEEPGPCCPAGNWIGINTYGGGGAGYGRDVGSLYLMCMEDKSRRVVMSWSGIRAGIFAGGEVSAAAFLLVNSGRHPSELKADAAKVLSGWDWDISVGVSWTKLIVSGGKTIRHGGKLAELVQGVIEAGKVSRAIKKAEGVGKTVEAARLTRKNEELLEELMRSGVADDLLDAAIKGDASALQAGGTGVNIPFGAGLQGGFWSAMDIELDIVSINGCKECDPSKR